MFVRVDKLSEEDYVCEGVCLLFIGRDHNGVRDGEIKGRVVDYLLEVVVVVVVGDREGDGGKGRERTDKVEMGGTNKVEREGTQKVEREGTHKVEREGTQKVEREGTHKVEREGTQKVEREGMHKGE